MTDYNTDHAARPSARKLVEELEAGSPFATHYRIDNDGTRTIVKPCSEIEPVVFAENPTLEKALEQIGEYQRALEDLCSLLDLGQPEFVFGPGCATSAIEVAIGEMKMELEESRDDVESLSSKLRLIIEGER